MKNVFWLIIPFASFLIGYLAMEYFSYSRSIQTPAIIGKSIHEAVSLLSPCHLTLQIAEEREVEDLPEGTIIQQTPNALARIKPRHSVFCIISKKTIPTAPAVTGKLVKNITDEITGITLKEYGVESIQPAGTIVAQDPQYGQPLTDKSLTVYIAQNGAKSAIIPVFLNHPVSDIKTFVETYPVNLEIIHADTVSDRHQCNTECLVIDQRPRAGTVVSLDPENPLHCELFVRKNR